MRLADVMQWLQCAHENRLRAQECAVPQQQALDPMAKDFALHKLCWHAFDALLQQIKRFCTCQLCYSGIDDAAVIPGDHLVNGVVIFRTKALPDNRCYGKPTMRCLDARQCCSFLGSPAVFFSHWIL